MQERDVQQIKELLAGVQVLAVAAKKVMADGKISVADLPVVIAMLPQVSTLVKAVEGIDQLPSEAKDLSVAEIEELIGAVLAMIEEVRKA